MKNEFDGNPEFSDMEKYETLGTLLINTHLLGAMLDLLINKSLNDKNIRQDCKSIAKDCADYQTKRVALDLPLKAGDLKREEILVSMVNAIEQGKDRFLIILDERLRRLGS